jgi:CMP-N-acetylneuraminic acid synthetase
MSRKIAALIAVREGSKRVVDKNIRPFCDTSLLEIKVKQALQIEGLSEVVVSSDSDKMLGIASSLGAATLKRPDEYATDNVPMSEVYVHLASNIDCDDVVYLHVTSPLLLTKTLQECVDTYKGLEDYDSLATVHRVQEYLWYNGKPLNYDPTNHPRSQDLPEICALNFAVNIIPRDLMVDRRNLVGNNFYPFRLDEVESIDVDSKVDFIKAEFLYEMLNFNQGA